MKLEFEKLQHLIEGRNLSAARREIRLRSKAKKGYSRAECLKLATLARQAYLAEEAINLLQPWVRAGGRAHAAPKGEELAEYGLALADIGAGKEALEIFKALDVAKHPQAFRGVVVAHFRRWEWEKTLPLIEKFLGRSNLPRDEELWARYFQGRALLHGTEELPRSERIFVRIVRETETQDAEGLRAEALLALADVYYLSRDWKRSLKTLNRLRVSEESPEASPLSLSVCQLRAEVRLMSRLGRGRRSALRELHQVRSNFARLERYERVRSCDYQEALALSDQWLLMRLYFGTPIEGARSRFIGALGIAPHQLPPHYDWHPDGEQFVAHSAALDLLAGTIGEKAVFKPGQLPLRTLRAIAADIYVPPRLPELFERIYEGEYFNPATAPARVRQAILKTRKWISANSVPLKIIETQGRYTLRPGAKLVLRFPRELIFSPQSAEAGLRGYLARARQDFSGVDFSAKHFARLLGLPSRTARRYLSEAVAAGLLQRDGRRKGACYRFAPIT